MRNVAAPIFTDTFETASQKRIPAQKTTTRTSSSTMPKKKLNSEQTEKGTSHDIATD